MAHVSHLVSWTAKSTSPKCDAQSYPTPNKDEPDYAREPDALPSLGTHSTSVFAAEARQVQPPRTHISDAFVFRRILHYPQVTVSIIRAHAAIYTAASFVSRSGIA